MEPTLIARWSSDGPDYSSGLCFGWIDDRPHSPLVEARRRAEALGLDVRRDYYAGNMVRMSNGMVGVKTDNHDPEAAWQALEAENRALEQGEEGEKATD